LLIRVEAWRGHREVIRVERNIRNAESTVRRRRYFIDVAAHPDFPGELSLPVLKVGRIGDGALDDTRIGLSMDHGGTNQDRNSEDK
jgi:hypothetical protein